MPAILSQDQKYKLEAMIDATSLSIVLEAIAEVCSAKADHIRENWADTALAMDWDKAATLTELYADALSGL